MNISTGTIIRTIILALALVNQVLVTTGHSMIPISDEQVTELITLAVTVTASLIAWWKNNSFTKEAIEADNYLENLRK